MKVKKNLGFVTSRRGFFTEQLRVSSCSGVGLGFCVSRRDGF